MEHILFRVGKRVALAVNDLQYIDLFLVWLNDPEVTKFLKRRSPMARLMEKEYLEKLHLRQDTDQSFAILAREGDAYIPIGVMGLHRISRLHGTASTGAIIGNKEYWGKGLGSDAKMLLLDYAFNAQNLRKITSSVLGFNRRSERYNEKCGYKVVGRRKEHIWSDGRYHDEVLMEVFKDDWLPSWHQFCKNGKCMTA